MAVLEIENVSKTYKTKGRTIDAVKGVSFSVNEGEIVGFIGKNGAGKSTTLKIVTGLAEPTSGSVRINGFDIKKDRIRALEKVGCIIETPELYKEWSAEKNLKYLASLNKNNVPKNGRDYKESVEKRAEELLKMVGLYDRRRDAVGKYSLGMKQRVGIAQALMCNPNLLVLDEPTNGLDPTGIVEVREILKKLSHEYGLAIVVSSHLLSEVQLMCDRFVVIDKGELVGSFKQSDFDQKDGASEIILQTDDVVKAKDVVEEIFGAKATFVGDGKISFTTERAVSEIAKELVLHDVNVLGINKKETSLEEFFLKVTEKEDK